MKKLFKLLLAILLLNLIISGCFLVKKDEKKEENKKVEENVEVTEDDKNKIENTIDISEDGEIEQKDDEIEIENEKQEAIKRDSQNNNIDFKIRYIARALPVEVQDEDETFVVQANDIFISENIAFIAYNDAGENFAGAVQIINIEDIKQPKILFNIKLKNIDVNAVFYDSIKDEVLFGGGGDPDVYNFRSFIARFKLKDATLDTIKNDIRDSIKSLPSFNLTAISKTDSIYVSLGAKDGGVAKLNDSLEVVTFREREDVRDIIALRNKNDIYGLAGTADSNLTSGAILGSVLNDSKDIEINDFGSQTHKATVDIFERDKNKITKEDAFGFLGLSKNGFSVYQFGGEGVLKDKEIVNYSNPIGDGYETNSASYDGGYVFTANGGYGFKIYRVEGFQVNEDTGKNYLDKDNFVSLIGYHKLEGSIYDGKNYSANHIEYKRNFIEKGGKTYIQNLLFVASGKSGLNIYTLTPDEEFEYEEIDNDTLEKIDEILNNEESQSIPDNSDLIQTEVELSFSKNTQVSLSFVDEGAGYKNQFGAFKYSGNAEDITSFDDVEDLGLLFENASKQGSGGDMITGLTELIGTFSQGEKIGFYLIQNGYNKKDVGTIYSISHLNSDKKNHFSSFVYNNKLILGIEDLTNLGDKDFNDLIIVLNFSFEDGVDLSIFPNK